MSEQQRTRITRLTKDGPVVELDRPTAKVWMLGEVLPKAEKAKEEESGS